MGDWDRVLVTCLVKLLYIATRMQHQAATTVQDVHEHVSMLLLSSIPIRLDLCSLRQHSQERGWPVLASALINPRCPHHNTSSTQHDIIF